MSDKPSVLRETDEEARKLARMLLRSAGYAALAVIDPDNGFPAASRVLLGTDIDGVPVILVSALSAHTKALSEDPRASLLVGEPGKGDPLAHARLAIRCRAERVDRATTLHDRIRTRFLGEHPKAKLYIDFPDFGFYRLLPLSASLNGGFGKAYLLPGEDLEIRSVFSETIARDAEAIVRELVLRRPGAVAKFTDKLKTRASRSWRISTVDAAGFTVIVGENRLRYDFSSPIDSYENLQSYISKVTYSIP
ncbi:HugZ family protein [Rhizobium tubonense]|uniref:Pyridoxamine 5'-phosphate oxidase n=1 Tax=Rhizobium tubonense TaxID=484088 RepID=A0A2W4ES83_9HYPH|nr:pyridoxamine 5'-phosphate oxidase family protein [Rhizobium tubonense]PZM13853.1 pyridoxamine 5'-phosphate oxidase [Rhizobium tubonense]